MEHFHSFNAVDAVALAYLALGLFVGIYRGLSGELARLLSIVLSFGLSLLAYRPIAGWMLFRDASKAPIPTSPS